MGKLRYFQGYKSEQSSLLPIFLERIVKNAIQKEAHMDIHKS